MKTRVDDVDRAILSLLQEDARMPCAEMARRLGYVSARTIRNRLGRLITRGIIAITVGAVPEALGYDIKADITLQVEPGRVREVAEAVAALDKVSYVAIVTGDGDLSVQVNCADLQGLQAFITQKIHGIPGVQRTRSYVLIELLKQSCDWQFPADLG